MWDRKPKAALAALAVTCLLAHPGPAPADTLDVTFHSVTTTTDARETSPALGFDGISNVVVYTRRAVVEGTSAPGDIYYQRVSSTGAPMGSPILVSTDLDASSDDRLNDVSGRFIVYTALDPANSARGMIRLYDTHNGGTIDLMEAHDTVVEARIHGDVVVWVQGAAGATRIELVDLGWPVLNSISLTDGANPAGGVEVGSRHVVWQEFVGGTTSDVRAYDLWAGEFIAVADQAAVHERAPATYGDFVVWQEQIGTTTSLWARNVTTRGAPFVVANPGATVANPSIDGDLIGYESRPSGTYDVYLYRISDGATFQVTDGPNDEILNNVFGRLVAFVDRAPDGGSDVSIAHLTLVPDAEPLDPCIALGGDADGDGVCTADDNCPDFAGVDQTDTDADGIGDICDGCPGDPANDSDGDGVCAPADNCPGIANADQADHNVDGIGDRCEVPIADAGPDQSTRPGQTVVLDGSGSLGWVASYAWSLVSRPAASASEPIPNGATAALTPDVPGDYVVGLVVTSAIGIASARDEVLVSTLNVPPVADAGADVAVTLGGTIVTLGGSSYDLDGDPISWAWTLVAKPETSAAALAGAGTAQPSFVADVAGEYVVELVVSDPWTASAPDTVLVSFTNLPPVASAGPNRTSVVGEAVTFDGTGSSDPNGDALTYHWSLVSAPAGSAAALANGSTALPTLVPDLPGSYVVSLVVNDGTVASPAANATLLALSLASQASQELNQVIGAVNALAPIQFKNPNMRHALTNKIQVVLADIEAGRYAEALAKLGNDIVRKTDGCAASGAPDANDWIVTCSAQGQLHPMLEDVIALLEALV